MGSYLLLHLVLSINDIGSGSAKKKGGTLTSVSEYSASNSCIAPFLTLIKLHFH